MSDEDALVAILDSGEDEEPYHLIPRLCDAEIPDGAIPTNPGYFATQWMVLINRLDTLTQDPEVPANVKGKALKDMGQCIKEVQALAKEAEVEASANEVKTDLLDLARDDPAKALGIIDGRIKELRDVAKIIKESIPKEG